MYQKGIGLKMAILLGVLISLVVLKVNSGEFPIPMYLIDYTSDIEVKGSSDHIIFDLKTEEDLLRLKEVCKTSKGKVEVYEYIAETYQNDVTKMFDVIDAFYYNIPLLYPNIEVVNQAHNVVQSNPKVKSKYEQINRMFSKKYINIKDGVKVRQPNYTVVTPIPKQEGQYVEYKVNEKLVGTSTRYPYVYSIDETVLHPGTNQIRVIVHNKDQKIQTKDFYVIIEKEEGYDDRQSRKDKTYPLTSRPQSQTIPVLMYHKFLREVTEDQRSIGVSTELFEEHLKRLLDEGYTSISFHELQLYLQGKSGLPEKPILITSDDGYLCNYTEAYPILKKYDVKATFFVSTAHVGKVGFQEHLSWEQALEMEKSGLIDIQSHSHRHLPMNGLECQQVMYEIDASFGEIQKNLGKRDVKVLAYPQFRRNKKTQKWVKERGVDLQVTDLIAKPKVTTPMDIQRIHVSEDMSSDALIKEIKRITRD